MNTSDARPADPAPSRAEVTASHLYTIYCAAVGGVAFNCDPLPTWAEFAADPFKAKQANAWRAVATAALLMENVAKSAATAPKFGALYFDDEASIRLALNAGKLHSAAWDFDQWLRGEIKHGGKRWDAVRARFLEGFGGLLEA